MKKKVFLTVQFVVLVCVLNFFAVNTMAQNFSQFKTTQFVDYSSTFNFDNAERQVFDLVNREREKKGFQDLEWDQNLARLARSYSQKMADENFFSHYDRGGATVMDRARAMRIKNWSRIGENLFESIGERSFMTVSVQQWMKSPGHKRNILDPQWTMSGIGIAESRDGKIYITQVFIEN